MSKKKKNKQVRADPAEGQKKTTFLCSELAYETLCCTGYTRLSQNPEIMSGVNKICDLISSMTIHLMENTENGDRRVKNELSRKIDIEPNTYMTKKTFLAALIRSLLLEGDGNCVAVPQTRNGYLENIVLEPPGMASFIQEGAGYRVLINGNYYDPGELLHFVINPDPQYPWKGTGYRAVLKDVVQNLKQAAATKKGFMESKWKPSIIVKVDSASDELSSPAGRRNILNNYIQTTDVGEPWVIPAETFDVTEIKPLSLNDLAISESVMLDKKTVAAILDVPPFLLGAGEFKESEWNNFINTRIKSVCNAVEQELTKKLLINPRWYWRFNIRSLYAYDIEKLSNVGANMYTRGIMKGNEVRDWLGLSPEDGLDELIILENYIPQGMIGDQKKLKGGAGDE